MYVICIVHIIHTPPPPLMPICIYRIVDFLLPCLWLAVMECNYTLYITETVYSLCVYI